MSASRCRCSLNRLPMLPQLMRVVCILKRMGHAFYCGDALVCGCHTYVSILIAGLRFTV